MLSGERIHPQSREQSQITKNTVTQQLKLQSGFSSGRCAPGADGRWLGAFPSPAVLYQRRFSQGTSLLLCAQGTTTCGNEEYSAGMRKSSSNEPLDGNKNTKYELECLLWL